MRQTSLKYRELLPDTSRVVVKIGSRVLCQRSGRPDTRIMRRLVADLSDLWKTGKDVVVVSSGAVGAGMEALRMKARPESLPDFQMCAAVGQPRLLGRYNELFSQRRIRVGQVLLTHDDFDHTLRMTNARRTMENLLRNRVIPIVNENDVVADEELKAQLRKLGDNDLLAALVAKLIRADLLIMLTTVSGFKMPDEKGVLRRKRHLERITRKILAAAEGTDSAISTGGMVSKLKAAGNAARAGCTVVLADGRAPEILPRIMRGDDVGTLILATPLSA